MPFSVVFISVFRRLSLRVVTSLHQTPFFLHLSTLAVKEIKWTTAIPIYTETTYWSFRKIKISQDCKITKQNPFCGDPPWNIRDGKARLYALLAVMFCRHLMLLRHQADQKVESRALCSTSRKLSCLHMTKSRPRLTHSPNSCDRSLPEGEVFQCLWETERFPNLVFWNPWFLKQKIHSL